LGTFRGGFQVFSDSLAEHLRGLGVDIRLSTAVKKISPSPQGGLSLTLANGLEQFDQCLVTVGPAQLAKLAPDLPQTYLQGLLSMQSMGAVVMVLALRQALSTQGYYWFNMPKSAGFPFLILVEHTNFVPPEQFGGDHILYIGDYLDTNHEYFNLTQEELQARFLPHLKRINPEFSPDWVRKSWLFRTTYAQPVPLVNHSKNIPDIRTPIAGLYFASMSQVYPWDRGTNFAIELGRRAASLMQEDNARH
jgi:protoporphyrinogen oxidase